MVFTVGGMGTGVILIWNRSATLSFLCQKARKSRIHKADAADENGLAVDRRIISSFCHEH
jgi:hypothetical protein